MRLEGIMPVTRRIGLLHVALTGQRRTAHYTNVCRGESTKATKHQRRTMRISRDLAGSNPRLPRVTRASYWERSKLAKKCKRPEDMMTVMQRAAASGGAHRGLL
jgi:hypothetical protein